MKIKTTFVALFFVLAIVGFVATMIWFPWGTVVPAAIAVWTGVVLFNRRKTSGKLVVDWRKVISVILMVLCLVAIVILAISFGWWALLAAAAFLGALIWFLHLIGKSAIIAGVALTVVVILFGVFCIQSSITFDVKQINVDVVNTDELNVTKVNATEVKATEVKATEVKATEVKATEVKATEVKATEVKATEVKATEVKATEVKATEVKATEVKATEVKATEVKATEVNATKVKATEVNATKVNATKVNTTKNTTKQSTKAPTTKATTTTATQKLTTTTTTVSPTTTTTKKSTTTTTTKKRTTTTTTEKSTTTTKKPTTTTTKEHTTTTTTTRAMNPSISVSTDYMQKGDTVIVTLKDATVSDVVIKYVDSNTGSWVVGGATLKFIGNNQYRLMVEDSLFEMAVDLTLGISGQTNYKMVTLEPCYD